jgi:UMF2 family putative MFS family transporter
MTTYTRPVLLLLCGLLLLTLAIAVLNTLVPLWLAHENLPTWQVGMVARPILPATCWERW